MPAELAAWLLVAALAADVESPADEAPDAEMLEFLGAFETKDGQWLDPLALDTAEPADETRAPMPREEKRP